MIGPVAKWAERHGISRQAAYKRLKEHGIPYPGGKVDFERADAAWQRSMNPLQQQRGAKHSTRAAAPVPAPPVRPATSPAPAGGTISTLAAAQLRREMVRLEKETLELAQIKGSLIKRDEVQQAWSEGMTLFQSRMLSIPDEVSDTLAATDDPVRCKEIVLAPIRLALTELSEVAANA